MSVPSFGGIRLIDDERGPLLCGAAFSLDRASRGDGVVTVGEFTFEVRSRARILVARGGTGSTYEVARDSALRRAHEALDLLSMHGVDDLAVNGVEDDHVAWWPTPEGLAVRVVSIAPFGIRIRAELTVTNASGQLEPPSPRAPVSWHPSFRFFRSSQASADLFDAFRNGFLALESILSSIAAQRTGSPAEGDSAWFRRALTAAEQIIPLSAYVPHGTPDPVAFLHQDLYRETRSATFHAKTGRTVLLPGDEADRPAVAASLDRLARLYLALAEAHLGVRRPRSSISQPAFREMSTATLDGMTVVASDDESPFDAADVAVNPGGGRVIALPNVRPSDAAVPFLAARLAWASAADLASLGFIRRAAGVSPDGATMLASVLEERLLLGSAARFEVLMGMRYRGDGIRTQFTT